MANTDTFDNKGRPQVVAVANESEDGSGAWHAVVVDSSGNLVVVAV